MASPTTAVEIDRLQHDYLRWASQFDEAACRWKRVYQGVWLAISGLTWTTLVLAIAGLALPYHTRYADLALHWLIPACSSVAGVLTVYQTLFGPRRRWLGYRAAVQGMWKTAMLYRARLPLFDGPEGELRLASRLAELREPVETRRGQDLPESLRQFARDFTLPPASVGPATDLPSQGLLPPLADAESYLDGRLRNQYAWYVKKAGGYRTRYFVFQAVIVALSLFNAAYTMLYGRAFWLVAAVTAVSLGVVAWRDFVDCIGQFLQYRQTALELRDIESRFAARQEPFDDPDARQRLQSLVRVVEQVLATEFHYWYAIRLRWKPQNRDPSEVTDPRPV